MRPKREVRVIGIDDSPFNKFKDRTVLVVGTVFRGGDWMDGVLSTRCTVDGKNSTKKISEMINKSKFKSQLRAIFLDGIAVGGFNVIDVPALHKKTKIPVIIVIRDYPDFRKIYDTLYHLKMKDKITLIEKIPRPVKYKKIYTRAIGISLDKAKELLDITCTRSFIPEPLRAAHLIGAGIVKGESKGRA